MIRFTIPYPKTKADRRRFFKEYSLNSIYAGKHWRRRKADSDLWHWTVQNALRIARIPNHPMEQRAKITFLWDDNLDCSNHAYMAKMIEDALKGWVLYDDNRRYVAEIVHRFHDSGEIVVEIEEAEDL